MSVKDDIKKAMEAEKAIIGSKKVTRSVKNGSVKRVIYAENTPKLWVESLKLYSGLSETAIEMFKGNSIELGRLCGKPFGITMLGIAK